ncbi:NAD(P)-dependent oxidoreductase [Gordonia sp. DT218]|uniref:NAD(P)-dependent oxidoreductase n=1 Tax=Gordonia sp. DT218 TaxID=3416659 RepID=UPI003CEAAE37
MKIGFIGAGRMGAPTVERLVAAGHEVTVLTRRPEALATAQSKGWVTAGTIGETVQDADIVISMVLNDEQVQEAMLGADGALAAMKTEAVLVAHTTCDPDTVALLADTGAARGVHVVDAAVSGGPRDIEEGQLTLWVGGDAAVLDAVRPALAAYASPVLHVGSVGHGQRVKLVNNALFVAQVGLAVDAVRLADAVGISESDILSAVQHGSGDSRALNSVAWIGVEHVGSRLAELMSKDVAVVRQIAERSGTDLGLLGEVLSSDLVEDQILCAGGIPDRALARSSTRTPDSMKRPAAKER